MDALRLYHLDITLALFALVIIQFLMLMSVRARLNKLSRMLRSLFAGPEGADLEAVLKNCLDTSAAAQQKGEELDAQLRALTQVVRGCVQHFGLVRYDAYGDVSGQQSFSLALLDADRNGVVISGLFSRSDSRCYGKAVVAGSAEQSLTDEEQNALDLALSEEFSAPLESGSGSGRKRPLRR
jgi:hypothetical protein